MLHSPGTWQAFTKVKLMPGARAGLQVGFVLPAEYVKDF